MKQSIIMFLRASALAVMVTALSIVQHAQAQFDIGDNVAGISIGLGGNYLASTSGSPAIGLSLEHGLMDLGPGVLGIGGYLGYKSLGYESRYFNYQSDWRYTYLIIGVRGAWHYNEWHGNSQLDTYGGLMLSYNVVSFKDNTVYPVGTPAYHYSSSSGLGLTGFLGARYYFNDQFAAHAELGYGIAILNVGVSYKF